MRRAARGGRGDGVRQSFTRAVRVGIAAVVFAGAHAVGEAAEPFSTDHGIRVVLLGTQGGPTFGAQRIGIGTLVEAGGERLLFDAGRGVTTGMARVSVNPVDITKVFITHLHSDHVISLPELLVYPWAQGRRTPLEVWGPSGTRSMMQNF